MRIGTGPSVVECEAVLVQPAVEGVLSSATTLLSKVLLPMEIRVTKSGSPPNGSPVEMFVTESIVTVTCATAALARVGSASVTSRANGSSGADALRRVTRTGRKRDTTNMGSTVRRWPERDRGPWSFCSASGHRSPPPDRA
jgi:hypothetical protein